jgi:ATP-dependent DNA helicase DinG
MTPPDVAGPDFATLFGRTGPLHGSIPDYRSRDAQLEFARAVHASMRDRSVLVAEAGTGTGKTLAYLVPAILSGGKVIISTGTRTLQDQLYQRDLPLVRDALRMPVSTALLKGRANYLCRYHLERALAFDRFEGRETLRHLKRLDAFASATHSGDLAEASEVPEDSPARRLAVSSRENCLGSECPHYDGCFVMEARKRALAAEIVVVNHHLFFADLWLKDEGVGELLPACNSVIFDEAHQVAETASLFFGDSVSVGQIVDLARDVLAEALVSARDYAPLPAAADAAEKTARDLRLVLDMPPGRYPVAAAEARAAFAPARDAMSEALAALAKHLDDQATRSAELKACAARAQDLRARLARWSAGEAASDDGQVRWVEVLTHGVALNSTPLSIATLFSEQVKNSARAWVFTSATLAVGEDFSLFLSELGIDDAVTRRWESPFDYPEQALLYLPRELPEPNAPGHTDAVVEAALPLIEAAGGRAFLLFTSLRAMNYARDLVEAGLRARALDCPLLMQGDAPRHVLLERFRAHGNAVLLGSQSFWEGVDVRGDALSLVVIDRLPFQPPDDPVLVARMAHLKAQGKSPFMDYQLPRAAITLKQGAGRLIRSETDRGVLMIGDIRLNSKSYGRKLVEALPPMARTRDQARACDFLRRGSPPSDLAQAIE